MIHLKYAKALSEKRKGFQASLRASSLCYERLVPQFPQNFVPGGLVSPHFEHFSGTGCIAEPQFPQNFMVLGICAPHLGHGIVGAGVRLEPQLPQNLFGAVFWKPHF